MTLLEAIASYLLRKSIHNDTSSHIKNTRSRDMFMIYVLVVWGPNDSPLNEGGRRTDSNLRFYVLQPNLGGP